MKSDVLRLSDTYIQRAPAIGILPMDYCLISMMHLQIHLILNHDVIFL